MKPARTLFISLILFTNFLICFGQEKPQARLIDTFNHIYCDDFLARLDNFFLELNNDSNAVYYSVIIRNDEKPLEGLAYEGWITAQLLNRKIDENRFVIVRGKGEEFTIQFWKVPAGAEVPSFSEAKWNFSLPPKTKPFIFYKNSDDQICSSSGSERMFSEILSANPAARGNLVIYEKSLKKFRKARKSKLQELSDISPNRLKFFYKKTEYSDIEFWIVPEKRK